MGGKTQRRNLKAYSFYRLSCQRMKGPNFQGKSSEHLCNRGLGLKESRMGTCMVRTAPPALLGNPSSVPTSSHPARQTHPQSPGVGIATAGPGGSRSPFPQTLHPGAQLGQRLQRAEPGAGDV